MVGETREVDCPSCDGSGEELEYIAPLYGEDLFEPENNWGKKTCSQCGGSGKVKQTLGWH